MYEHVSHVCMCFELETVIFVLTCCIWVEQMKVWQRRVAAGNLIWTGLLSQRQFARLDSDKSCTLADLQLFVSIVMMSSHQRHLYDIIQSTAHSPSPSIRALTSMGDGASSDGWTTVHGSSGGRRNAKSKYRLDHGLGRGGGSVLRKGPPINWQQKLAEIGHESSYFDSLSAAAQDVVVGTVTTIIRKHIAEMKQTTFFKELQDMLLISRRAMQCLTSSSASPLSSSNSLPSESSPLPAVATPLPDDAFDIVIYGIGRYAEWSGAAHASSQNRSSQTADPHLTPASIRASIRTASRSPQLQFACILAIAQEQQQKMSMHSSPHLHQTNETYQESTQPNGCIDELPSTSICQAQAVPPSSFSSSSTLPSSSSSSMPSIHLFDPMLSSLEKVVARSLGVELIHENEEGKRQVTRPTLFFMPHCPQALYNNVLWSNWGLGLSRVLILGNSLRNYAQALSPSSSTAHLPSTHGFVRAPKKKKSQLAKLLTKDTVCCQHENGVTTIPRHNNTSSPNNRETASAASQLDSSPSTAIAPSAQSCPYPCLAPILPLLHESEVRNTHPSLTVFNDLNLHHFILPQELIDALIKQQQQQQEVQSNVEGQPLPQLHSTSGAPSVTSAQQLPPHLRPFLTRPPPWTSTCDQNSASGAAIDTEIIAASATAGSAQASQ